MTNTTTSVRTVTPSTDSAINGILIDEAWVGPITYAFPTTGSAYGANYNTGENTNNFAAIDASQIIAAQFGLDADVGPVASAGFSIEGFTALSISSGPATTSTVRIGTSGALDPGAAYAYLPEDNQSAGDIWFAAPEVAQVGNFEWSTMLHEIGHAMGLDHAHEGNTVVPAQFDHHEYTIMSYRPYQGASVDGGTSNGEFGFPQTFMMYDIAALQYLYGANYTINNTDTVYSWNPNSGDALVNGAVGINAVDNTIFATIWDGGGTDTYDLSAYSTNLTLNLTAGGNSLFSGTQLADLGDGNAPSGNIYNALLFEGNTASLIENAIGGSGNDTIIGNEVSNVLTGNGGNDILDGGAGIDYVAYNGVQANYTITANANGTYSITGEGTDTVSNVEFARFTDGDVALAPSGGGDDIYGTVGDDIILGLEGNDTIFGLEGDDKLKGLGGDDILYGGVGDDFFSGSTGSDSIYGGSGNDLAYGGADNDLVNGDAGNDSLYGGAGDDVINGGAGTDTLVGQSGNDTLNGGGSADTLSGGAGNDVLNGDTGTDTLYGQSGDDTINGGDGADLITGQYGADIIDGGADNDNIFAGFGEDTVYGGTGDDTIRGEGQNDELHGGDGDDTLTGGTGGDMMYGDADNDTMYGQGGFDTMFGGAGNDALYGGDANDVISGDAGNDTLFGQAGNDTLNGGTGADILNGGTGSDTFVFAQGFESDTVNGFRNYEDTLLISDFGFGTVEALLDPANGYVTQTDANTVTFDFGNGDVLTINSGTDFTIADLIDDIIIE